MCHMGYSVSLKTLPPHFLQNIRNDLYVKPIENPNFPTNESSYPIFRMSKTKIYLPRYYGITEYSTPKTNTIGNGETIDVSFNGSLREIQETTIRETIKNFEDHGGGLVSLDTGLGKTVVALKLVSIMKTKTLVLVHAEFLLDQWVERIKTFLPDARIGIIQQDRCEYQDCDIVVGMIQSIVKREYPKECFRSFGMLQIDECFVYHQYILTNSGPMMIGELYNKWINKNILPKILSYNESTKETEYKNMTYAWKRSNKNLLQINYQGGNIECTYNHKILTPTGYTIAGSLNVGDLLKCNEGYLHILSIFKIKNFELSVYDIEVEDNHNFICTSKLGNIGPIVHNCHHIGSKTFSSIFFKVQTKYMLGLSATPDRKDGLSKVIYWFLGPQIVHFKRETGKPKIKFVFTDVSEFEEKFNKLGKVNNPTMISDLTARLDRNALIIKIVQDYLTQSRKILILTDRRQQCDYLLTTLTSLGVSAGIYVGGLKSAQREISVTKSVIIGTYQASGEGFDVPELDTLVLASPKSDIEQAVGRILRQKNKNEPIVIDIVDQFSIFKGQYYKRKKFYKLNGYSTI
jgi:superfamily II DNA or RNA helicase